MEQGGLFKSGVREFSLTAESEVCKVESLRQFLSCFERSNRTKPQAHARVSEEPMRGRMELQKSERHIFSSRSNLVLRRETDWVSFMIKLLRAYGGCLGARRR